MRITNLLIACVGLVACTWFAIGVRQARDLDQATAIVTQSAQPTKAQLADAASLLDSAGILNPDSEVRIVRAQLAQLDNQPTRAMQIADDVVRDEPQNLQAWYQLATLAGRDQRTLFHALAEINKLDPPPPRTKQGR